MLVNSQILAEKINQFRQRQPCLITLHEIGQQLNLSIHQVAKITTGRTSYIDRDLLKAIALLISQDQYSLRSELAIALYFSKYQDGAIIGGNN